MRLSSFFLTALLTLPLHGCGNLIGASAKTLSSTATTANGTLVINSFSPPTSSLAATPTSVVVYFNESNLDVTSASTASNYVLTCNASSTVASQAYYVYGTSYVTVTLPAISATIGDVCSLFVSANVIDTSGAALSGTREADYYMTSASSAFNWAESASTAFTSIMGGNGGSSYNDAGADGLALSGLNLNVNTLIMGVNGAWSNAAGTISYGGVHGSSPTSSSLTCPSGYRITGIFGYYSTYVEAVGIYCKNATQTMSYTSAQLGTATGSTFSVSCNAGQFATSLYGSSGAYVDGIGIGCR
jgi:hypothetical protein